MYLMNISNCSGDLEKFQGSWENVELFLKKHQLDGVEMIRYEDDFLDTLPKDILKGYHLRYFPTWLEFYRGEHEKLLEMFGDDESIKQHYGGTDPSILVDTFKKEHQRAINFGAEYMVYHVSHVTTEHSFTRKFTYTDDEILDATADLVNKSFKGPSDVALLFENLWWPGLTLLDEDKALRFLDQVHYENKGFMLDLSHFVITNPKLRTADEAADFILDHIEKWGELKNWIRGFHVNLSLPGAYLSQDHDAEYTMIQKTKDPFEKYIKIIEHIKKIDCHIPFDCKKVKTMIDKVKPEYVVYEVLTKTFGQLDDYITCQNIAAGRC